MANVPTYSPGNLNHEYKQIIFWAIEKKLYSKFQNLLIVYTYILHLTLKVIFYLFKKVTYQYIYHPSILYLYIMIIIFVLKYSEFNKIIINITLFVCTKDSNFQGRTKLHVTYYTHNLNYITHILYNKYRCNNHLHLYACSKKECQSIWIVQLDRKRLLILSFKANC